MPCRLKKEDIVTITNLASHGVNNCQIAKQLGITEGTVRYHLQRHEEGAADGRSDKPFQAEVLAAVIDQWYEDHQARQAGSESSRPVNLT